MASGRGRSTAARGAPRVLLVTHELSRSGAPRVASLVARVLRDQGHDVSVVSRFPGPLLDDFLLVAPTTVEPLHRVRRRLRPWASLVPLGRAGDLLVALWVLVRARPDLVYVNSSAAAVYLRPSRWLRRPVVLHVHESADVARPFLEAAGALAGLDGTSLVACSPSVESGLDELSGSLAGAVAMIPSVPDGDEVRRLAEQGPGLEVDEGVIVIGCCGSVEARKGPDLWVEVAREVLAARPGLPLRFVWVGDAGRPGRRPSRRAHRLPRAEQQPVRADASLRHRDPAVA